MPAVDLSDFSHFTVAALELLGSLETQQVFKQSKELRSGLLRRLSTAQHPLFDTMLSRRFSVFLFSFLQIKRMELVFLPCCCWGLLEKEVFSFQLLSQRIKEEVGRGGRRGISERMIRENICSWLFCRADPL